MNVLQPIGQQARIQPDGPALLLMNSLGTTRELWEAPAAALAGAFRVVRFDNRGHGESGAPEGEYTIARLGCDALAVLDELGIARADVAGVSIGGQMALWLAVHATSRVGRAVLLNTGARIQHTDFWQQRIDRAGGGKDDGAVARRLQADGGIEGDLGLPARDRGVVQADDDREGLLRAQARLLFRLTIEARL